MAGIVQKFNRLLAQKLLDICSDRRVLSAVETVTRLQAKRWKFNGNKTNSSPTSHEDLSAIEPTATIQNGGDPNKREAKSDH